MNVMIVSPEAVPFAKTGGLADVAGALPKYLTKLGVNACLVMPLYQKVTQAGLKLVKLKPTIKVPIGEKVYEGCIWEGRLPDSEAPVYFLDQRDFYNRPELYGTKGKDYTDNCQRFVFFCRGTLELIRALELKIDVLHANDWQSGLIPVYIKTLYADGPDGIGEIATLFTVHNLAYQGLFWHWDMPLTGLSWDLFNWTQLEFYGKLSFMKGALTFADALSTVSKQYAKEIQTEEHGCGLEGVLTQRREALFGVVNGVDYNIWNPEVDELIPATYSTNDLTGKRTCKSALQMAQGLPVRENIPLIGLISRLVDQKGFDILEDCFDDLMGFDVQMVLLGTGETRYHELFEKLSRKYESKFAANLTFDNTLAHRIEAASDMYLMPSEYEPCGLNQIYSLKYGSVPIVRETGGLKDTIVNVTDATLEDNTATGFSFRVHKSAALLEAVKRALAFYSQKNGWSKLVVNCMKQDWSWERAAQEYIQIYSKTQDLKLQARKSMEV
ncbi:MAG: glycogen synthase [Planctomycetes bacterium DG_58]|nr:MAG: glycogen synthase [Planctomycetes bacterium DG_58]KPL04237.1 MAG: glycogen synthase [Planctomycetes bacterium SM23_65]